MIRRWLNKPNFTLKYALNIEYSREQIMEILETITGEPVGKCPSCNSNKKFVKRDKITNSYEVWILTMNRAKPVEESTKKDKSQGRKDG